MPRGIPKNGVNRGWKMTDEKKKKISEWNKKHPQRFWLGKKRSLEDRKKMSINSIGKGFGRKLTLEHKKILSESKKGDKNPAKRLDVRKKISKSVKKFMKNPENRRLAGVKNIGRNHSIESRKKMSNSKKGEKAYQWKGGMSIFTKQIRRCFEYRQWRSDVFTRDNFICQECGNNGYLEAHHIKTFSDILEEYKIRTLEEALLCEELWNINNGITLCKGCHNKTKKRKK